jgi:hypothetical protein
VNEKIGTVWYQGSCPTKFSHELCGVRFQRAGAAGNPSEKNVGPTRSGLTSSASGSDESFHFSIGSFDCGHQRVRRRSDVDKGIPHAGGLVVHIFGVIVDEGISLPMSCAANLTA